MSPELITLIGIFIAMVGLFINLSNKIDSNNKMLTNKIDDVNKELTNKIDNVNKDLTNFKIEIKDELTNFKIEIKDELTNFKVEVNNRLSKIESKLDIYDERYNATKEQIIATNQRIDKIELVSQDVLYKLADMPVSTTNGVPNDAQNIEEPQLELEEA